MSRSREDELRFAVRELAGQARTAPDLAARAIDQGRRLRARRRATAAAAALVAAAVLALPFVLLRPDAPARVAAPDQTAPAGTSTPDRTAGATASPDVVVRPTPGADWTKRALVLPGGWVVAGAMLPGPSGDGYVLDRGRDRYLRTDGYDGVWRAPQGAVSAVADDDRPGEIGLVDAAAGKTRWHRTGQWIMSPQWSPDGLRLALTIFDKDEGALRFGVLDTTGDFRVFGVDTDTYLCTDHCFFTWSRDGREVVLQQTDPNSRRSESERHARRGVQLFSPDDGRPTRFVAMPGDPAGPWSWSPDGRLVVVQGRTEPLLVEAGTGRVVRALPTADVAWISVDRLLYRRPGGSRDYVLADLTGRELERQPLPRELVGREITVGPR
ncbi:MULTISPECIES: hypothetical protein [unclassified Micromonospora]|uniref:hypothetical protein n=1 Tax=unclassified Micromonospora TaxID=2617518 RepID=UPI00332E0856